MNKKHYIKLVKILKQHNIKDKSFIKDLCLLLEEENKAFNQETFIKAIEQ